MESEGNIGIAAIGIGIGISKEAHTLEGEGKAMGLVTWRAWKANGKL